MKKLFLFLVGIVLITLPIEAQLVRSRTFAEKEKTGFNRISVGYDAMFLDHDFSTLNGVNLQYIHGFRVSKLPLFIEFGVDASYNAINSAVDFSYYDDTSSTTWIDRQNSLSIRIPLNISYKINLGEKFSIQPYTGLNFKINPLFKYHYSKEELRNENLLTRFYERSNNKMFQIGWQIGLGFNISKLYLGVQYGLDFMPRANIETESYTYNDDDYGRNNYKSDSFDLKSSRLLVSLGINF